MFNPPRFLDDDIKKTVRPAAKTLNLTPGGASQAICPPASFPPKRHTDVKIGIPQHRTNRNARETATSRDCARTAERGVRKSH
jgi:hypothetical protein